MKNIITQFDKNLENRVRLGIMSLLMVNDWVDFTTLKEMLNITDGNLASHIIALEKCDYIETFKGFVGKKPKTTYKASDFGKNAFKIHLQVLEQILKSHNI